MIDADEVMNPRLLRVMWQTSRSGLIR